MWKFDIDEFGGLSFSLDGRRLFGIAPDANAQLGYNIRRSMVYACDLVQGKLENVEPQADAFAECAVAALHELGRRLRVCART